MKKTSMRKDLFVLLVLVAAFAPREAFAKDKKKKVVVEEEEKTEKKPAKADTEEKDSAEEEEDMLADSGLSIGGRAGYALPLGTVAKDPRLNGANDLSRYASGMFPFTADVGWRISKHFYVGGTFTFGIVSTASEVCGGASGACTSSANDIRAGGMLKYTFSPDKKLTPWIGAGAGYEVFNLSTTVGTVTTDSSVKGWELLNTNIGLDYRVATHATIGPVVGFSLAQYTSLSQSRSDGQSVSTDLNQTALHHWFSFGFAGRYDL